jgi:hypothetical protein
MRGYTGSCIPRTTLYILARDVVNLGFVLSYVSSTTRASRCRDRNGCEIVAADPALNLGTRAEVYKENRTY